MAAPLTSEDGSLHCRVLGGVPGLEAPGCQEHPSPDNQVSGCCQMGSGNRTALAGNHTFGDKGQKREWRVLVSGEGHGGALGVGGTGNALDPAWAEAHMGVHVSMTDKLHRDSMTS